jgi:hypothetical protein
MPEPESDSSSPSIDPEAVTRALTEQREADRRDQDEQLRDEQARVDRIADTLGPDPSGDQPHDPGATAG